MAEKLNFTTESSDEDSDKKKSSKKGEQSTSRDGRKLSVPLRVERSREQEAKVEKEALPQPPRSFIEKLIAGDSQQVEKEQKLAALEIDDSHTEVPVAAGEAAEESANSNEVITQETERSVAEDLSSGAEISLHEIAQIAPERDEQIVDEALEIATSEVADAESVPETLEESQEEQPVVLATAEVEPAKVETEVLEPEQSTVVAATRPVIPILPRSRRYGARPASARQTPIGFPIPQSAGGPGGNVPPQSGGYNPNTNPGYNPNQNQSFNPNTAAAARAARTKAEEIEWQGRQQGRREGLFAGLLVGGGIEHFRHKRREKKMEKQQKKETRVQQKRVERLEYDFAAAKQAQQHERARVETDVRQNRVVTAIERAEQSKTPEELKKNQEQIAQQSKEVLLPDAEIAAALPKDHRIERSAWHNIEVDSHGKAVQESTIDYGQEYYKERAHEVMRRQFDGAAGEVALVAAALSDDAASKNHSPTSPPTVSPKTVDTSQLTQMAASSTRVRAQKVLKAVTTPPSSPFTTLVWLAVLIIIAIVVITIAL